MVNEPKVTSVVADGFESKDVLGKVAKKAKEYFFEVEQDRI